MRFPALAIAFLFATGILVGGIFAPTLPHAFAATLAAAFLLLVFGVAFLREYVTLAWIASLLAWCLLGAAAIHAERLRVPTNQVTRLVAENRLELAEPLRWRGQLRSDPLRLPWGIRYDVDLDQVQSAATWISVSGGLRADYFFDERSRDAPPLIRAGDRIELLLRARLVRNFADPGVTDHRALMADQNIYLTGSPRNTTLIEKIPGPPPTIANRLARARGRLLRETDTMLAGTPDSAAVARAMLLGDRSFLDSQQIEAFRDTGVYHVLVLAGLHVGMLVAALLWVGRKLRLPLVSRTFITLAALGAYVAVVEDRTPIVRASLMAAAYLLGRLLFRRTHLLNAVGLAALLVLLARPSELTDASFLLSFLAVGVIAGIAAPWLEKAVEPYLRALDHLGDVARDGAHAPRVAQFRLDARATANWLSARLPKAVSPLGTSLVTAPARAGLRVWELIVISVALQVEMIPLMAQYFHRISLVGFAATLPAVLLTGIIVPLGFAALCTSLVWGALKTCPGSRAGSDGGCSPLVGELVCARASCFLPRSISAVSLDRGFLSRSAGLRVGRAQRKAPSRLGCVRCGSGCRIVDRSVPLRAAPESRPPGNHGARRRTGRLDFRCLSQWPHDAGRRRRSAGRQLHPRRARGNRRGRGRSLPVPMEPRSQAAGRRRPDART